MLAGAAGIAAALLLLTIATPSSVAPPSTLVAVPSPTAVVGTTPLVAPTPAAAVRVPPPEVQAFADRVNPSFDGVMRMDRKVVVQLGDLDRRDSPGIAGATDATWAIAVVGDIAQTRGLMPAPNSQCAVWFVDSLGLPFAFQRGAVSACDPYVASR